MNVEMRASDEDRLRVIAVLQRHTAAGRLSLDEFSERVSSVYSARTLIELATVTRDLPGEPAPPDPPGAESGAQHLVIAFVVAMVVLVLLGVVFSFR